MNMSNDLGSFVIFLMDVGVVSLQDFNQDHSVIDMINQPQLLGIPKVRICTLLLVLSYLHGVATLLQFCHDRVKQKTILGFYCHH